MLPGASESMGGGLVTSLCFLKVTSLSTFTRALGFPGAGTVLMQGWPQKSYFRGTVKVILNCSIPTQGGPWQKDKWSDGQKALRHLQRGQSPSNHLSQICSNTTFGDKSTPNSLHFLLTLFLSLHRCHTLATLRCV